MIFDRVANLKTSSKVLNELEMIPSKALQILNEFGVKIYCFDNNFKPSCIGLIDRELVAEDGRSLNETSLYLPKHKAILIHDCDIEEEKNEIAFSTILHEIGHAFDHALGNKIGGNKFLSYIEPKIYEGWQNNKALDWYADINPCEYFAQAFMAYVNTGIGNYKPLSYREHTIEELKIKDSDMFYYLNSLLR